MKDNNLLGNDLNISYLALLTEYDYQEEFNRLYPESVNYIKHLLDNNPTPSNLTKINSILNYYKKSFEVEVGK